MAGQNRNKFEECLILLSQGNLTYEQANDSVLEPMQRQALLFALANVAALPTVNGCVCYINIVTVAYGDYLYRSGELETNASTGKVYRIKLDDGTRTSSLWNGTKPTTQAELESLTFT